MEASTTVGVRVTARAGRYEAPVSATPRRSGPGGWGRAGRAWCTGPRLPGLTLAIFGNADVVFLSAVGKTGSLVAMEQPNLRSFSSDRWTGAGPKAAKDKRLFYGFSPLILGLACYYIAWYG